MAEAAEKRHFLRLLLAEVAVAHRLLAALLVAQWAAVTAAQARPRQFLEAAQLMLVVVAAAHSLAQHIKRAVLVVLAVAVMAAPEMALAQVLLVQQIPAAAEVVVDSLPHRLSAAQQAAQVS